MSVRRATLQKLTAPRADGSVPRARVRRALERALHAGVVWVAAPAGYGKSTAVADFVARRSEPCLWYRVDAGDRDSASFFHHLALARRAQRGATRLPLFGPEYADQALAFARRFFRALFAGLPPGTLLVLDDVHHVQGPQWDELIGTLLRELPEHLRCACLSRTLPAPRLGPALQGRLIVLSQATLEFSQREARRLVARHLPRGARAPDIAPARGWAAGLVLLAQQAALAGSAGARPVLLGAVARQMFASLSTRERDALCKLSLLRDITPELASALTGSGFARRLLERLQRRQWLVTRGATERVVFQLHDLLRDFLRHHLDEHAAPRQVASLRRRAARVLQRAGRTDEAVELALQAHDWRQARRFIVARAPSLLAAGQRATLIRWGLALPEQERAEAWLCYWIGVAHLADDATAEIWLARAFTRFGRRGEARGQRLAAAQAVLSKTDSWRTHRGLGIWTRRLRAHLDRPGRDHDEAQLLVWSGMLRAVDYAENYRSDGPDVARLRARLLARLGAARPADTPTLRLIASETLIEHAGTTGAAALFEQAVDNVLPDLREGAASPWALGLWLIAFGTVSGRYFPYARHGFAHRTPEQALRAALELGEREGLRGVEFGALYHLQLLAKLRGDLNEFSALVARLSAIADSRHTTQVAVSADCQAALHTLYGRHVEARRACTRFMSAIAAADEPPVERWPHFVTHFQVLLGERRAEPAARALERVLPLFDGELRRRTAVSIALARACAAKWRAAPDYLERLRVVMGELHALDYTTVLANLPTLLSELCADALTHRIAPEYCQALIARRGLRAPDPGCAAWPWALRVRVLGRFTLERDGAALPAGTKAPTRALNIVRLLALSPECCCALEELHERLWPDLDGDQAKAACEQALHRLRRLLGRSDLVLQSDGTLRLAEAQVWVDLQAWQLALRLARAPGPPAARRVARERAFWDFGGPLLPNMPDQPWSVAAAERVRGEYLDLALTVAADLAATGATSAARRVLLQALEHYPDAAACYEALVRASLARDDLATALEDHRRYERVLGATRGTQPSSALVALIARARAAGRVASGGRPAVSDS